MDDELVFGILGLACVIVVVALAALVCFFLTLQTALGRCLPRNRTMEPGAVWLNVIPIFNLYLIFHTVGCVSESLRNEFRDRDIPEYSDFGKRIGIAAFATSLLGSVIGIVARMGQAPAGQFFGRLVSLAGSAMLIVYWVRISSYSRQLAESDSGSGRSNEGSTDIQAKDR